MSPMTPWSSSTPYRTSPPSVLAKEETSARNSRLSSSLVPGRSSCTQELPSSLPTSLNSWTSVSAISLGLSESSLTSISTAVQWVSSGRGTSLDTIIARNVFRRILNLTQRCSACRDFSRTGSRLEVAPPINAPTNFYCFAMATSHIGQTTSDHLLSCVGATRVNSRRGPSSRSAPGRLARVPVSVRSFLAETSMVVRPPSYAC